MARSIPKSLASSVAAAAKKVIGRAAASTVGATDGGAKESAAPRKAPTKKARAAVKTSAKKISAKKAPAKKARAAVKTSATRTSATTAPAKIKTAPAQTMSVKKDPVSNSAPTKKSAKPSSAKTAPVAKKSAKKSAKKASTSSLVVKVGEESWTKAELDEVIAELHGQRNKLAHVIEDAEAGLAGLMKDAGDGAGHDQADMGATSFERDHELTVVHIERDMVAQIDKALARIDDGTYGICEVCAEPIGKMRLMAFPRATLCLPCKQREERR